MSIRKLYAIEQRIKDQCEEERYRTRQEESKAVLDKMKQWLDKHSPGLIYGEALTFLPHLRYYCIEPIEPEIVIISE